jgi:hypothetical protein
MCRKPISLIHPGLGTGLIIIFVTNDIMTRMSVVRSRRARRAAGAGAAGAKYNSFRIRKLLGFPKGPGIQGPGTQNLADMDPGVPGR